VNEQMTHMMHIAKKLKLKSSFYSDIWSMTKEYLGLKHERHVLKSRMSFLDEPHPQKSEGWWEEALKGQLWQSELGAIEQQQKIAREYAQELWERPESTDLFVRLFTSSKLGLDIQSVGGLGGPRDNSDQSNMRKDMIAAYCLECLEAITGTSTEVHDPVINTRTFLRSPSLSLVSRREHGPNFRRGPAARSCLHTRIDFSSTRLWRRL
jgi:hypothetical protein